MQDTRLRARSYTREHGEDDPAIRDYAAFFLPLALAIAGIAWTAPGDAVRFVAVMVVATPCPLILAAPIALISGVSRAARRGVIVKGALVHAAQEGVAHDDLAHTLERAWTRSSTPAVHADMSAKTSLMT